MYGLYTHFGDNILPRAWTLFYTQFKWLQVLYNLTSVIYLHKVCSIWPIDRTVSGVITPGQSGPENNSNEGLCHISQISKDVGGGGNFTLLQRCSQHIFTAPSDWAGEIRGWVGTFKITTLLWSTKILKKILETWDDLLSLLELSQGY